MFVGEIFPGTLSSEREDDELVVFIHVREETVADFDGVRVRTDNPKGVEALTPIGEGLDPVEKLSVVFTGACQVVGNQIRLHVFAFRRRLNRTETLFEWGVATPKAAGWEDGRMKGWVVDWWKRISERFARRCAKDANA